jgi:LacI family transcriptional regulator
MDDHANHLWLAGYTAFQALAPARDRMPHFITPRWDKEGFLRWFRRWRPEAIITINDDIVRWLRSEKIRVPQDVSCVTLYWRESRAYLSGFYQNHEVMAAGAVDLVAAQLNRNERGLPERTKTMLFQADWRDGSTHRVRKSESTDAPLRVWTA